MVANNNQSFPNIYSIQPGDLIGDYRIIGKHAEGAFKVVYLAEEIVPTSKKEGEDHRLNVLKFLKPYSELTAETAKRSSRRSSKHERMEKFFHDIEMLMDMFKKKGSHENIAELVGKGAYKIGGGDANEEGLFYFVEEYVKGKTLRQIIDEAKADRSILSPKFYSFTLNMMVQLGGAVSHMHEKDPITPHLDLKPGNILIEEANSNPVITDVANLTIIGEESYALRVGSRLYRAPEQLTVSREDRIKASGLPADMWALGVILYECLTGDYPFETTPQDWSDLSNGELRKVKDQLRYNIKQRAITPVYEKNTANAPKGSTIANLVEALLEREVDKRPGIHNTLNRMKRAYNKFFS